MSCCGGCFEGASKAAVTTKGKKAGGSNDAEKEKSFRESQAFHGGLDFIDSVSLFKTLPKHEHPRLAKAFTFQKYSEGQDIIKQGDVGDRFFCIKSGQAKVLIGGDMVNTLKAGDYFGEAALLNDAPRNATIRSSGSVECAELSRADFDALELKFKLHFKKRKAIVQAEDEESFPPPAKKTPEQSALMLEALRINKNIGPFLAGVKDAEMQQIVDHAFPKLVTAGNEEVITQGSMNANLFYILESGSGEAILNGQSVAKYKNKDSFGGLALLYQAPRAATVRVTAGSKLWCVPRKAMRGVLQAQVKKTVEQYASLLENVKMLDHVSKNDKMTLADALTEITYWKDQMIHTEGKEATRFYILKSGNLEVTQGGRLIETKKVEQGRDLPYFGERALTEDKPMTASVKVTSEKATLLVLERSTYENVVKPVDGMQAVGTTKYSIKALETICLLGCGGFGKVTLVKDPPTGNFFALKSLSKGHVIKEQQQLCVMNEKKILCMTHSPFLVQCAATFNTKDNLLFLLEPAMGGELYTIYIQNRFHGNVKQARFYSACVLRGLEHLHERSIIYRDMKPENLLLDKKGYCKITDFGLAKFVIGKTFTICGTLDYFCPELLKGTGCTTSLDWWTLGILIYEFMMGAPPFEADDPGKLFAKMMEGIQKARWPKTAAADNWPDLVKKMCTLEPSERLPVRAGGSNNVVEHKWYKDAGFDWKSLTDRTMKPPWDPNVKAMDGSNFDANEEDAPPEIAYKDPGDGWDRDFEQPFGPASFD